MKTLDPWKERGLKMVDDLPRRVNGYLVKPPTRWLKQDNGRTIPLNSAAWKRLRKSVLASEPLCRMCTAQGLTVPATDVDHMHGAWDNRRESLQPLCKSHHSLKTQAEYHGREMRQGCDINGYPIGSDHHWNKAAVGPSGGLADGVQAEKSPATDGHEPTCSLRAHQST